MSAECPPRRLLTGCPVLPNIPSQADSCARSFIHVNRKEAQKADFIQQTGSYRQKYTDTTLIWDRQLDPPPEPNRTGSSDLHNRKSEVFTCGTGASFCLHHAHSTF